MAEAALDTARVHGFQTLGAERPAGGFVAYARPAAAQAAIRGDGANAEFLAAAEAALGVPLPVDSRIAQNDGALSIFRLGPDNWLAVHDDDAAFGVRVEGASGFHGINLSSSRARLRLEGAEARDLLSTGCRLDLRASAFPAGAFAQAPLGNATAIIHCQGDDAFDIYIARSFAESWLVWLRHAGEEFSLVTS